MSSLPECDSSSPAVRYGTALISGAIALLLATQVPPVWALKLPLVLFYGVLIITSAWVGGLWPGLLSTVLCIVGAVYWIEPYGALWVGHPADVVGLVLFLLIGATLSAFGESVARAVRIERASREVAENAAAAERSAGQVREHTLAMVAHDLRDPLAVIDLNAGLIARASTAGAGVEISRRAAVVHRTVQRMNRLLRSLLDTALIDSGGLALDLAPESPAALLAEVVETHADEAEAKHIQMRSEAPAGLPSALCDRDRILQVLTNLTVNALKFTPPGGTITLRADVAGRFVRFSVTDTGLGIDADKLPRIFERYFGERRKQNGGLGLGLFIAKAIVESHHGTIEVESGVGEGSTFAFTVPLLHQACATDQALGEGSITASANHSPAA
ncbi:HAMP domain-containing sensor histidine kinase [Sorangium sp. So ce726]|uniref:sensor histidine kinase n=1 Tax=Sorangium sp. So ce726 TaxID=3133319 RepID=UPI003F5EE48D